MTSGSRSPLAVTSGRAAHRRGFESGVGRSLRRSYQMWCTVHLGSHVRTAGGTIHVADDRDCSMVGTDLLGSEREVAKRQVAAKARGR